MIFALKNSRWIFLNSFTIREFFKNNSNYFRWMDFLKYFFHYGFFFIIFIFKYIFIYFLLLFLNIYFFKLVWIDFSIEEQNVIFLKKQFLIEVFLFIFIIL